MHVHGSVRDCKVLLLVYNDVATTRLQDDKLLLCFVFLNLQVLEEVLKGKFLSKRSNRTRKGMQMRCQVPTEEQSQQMKCALTWQ